MTLSRDIDYIDSRIAFTSLRMRSSFSWPISSQAYQKVQRIKLMLCTKQQFGYFIFIDVSDQIEALHRRC